MNFLRALADGVTIGFSTKDIIKKYDLGYSSNVQRIKKALVNKDLICVDGEKITFEDALFKIWISRS